MRRAHAFFLIGIPVVLIGVGCIWLRTPHVSIPSSVSNVPELRSAMEKAIRAEGPARAYALLKKTYAGESFSTRHNAAHIFGESLYVVGGISAVAVCDADFNFGCFHGFMTRAISSAGLSIIPQLDTVCGSTNATTTCQHGLGHGILEYMGHEHLTQALEACSITRKLDPIAGCTSGIFMEYNVPLTSAPDGSFSTATRPLKDAAHSYDPCPSLSEEFRQSCYYALPQWWEQIYSNDFSIIGPLCVAVTNEKERTACLLGLGSVIGPQVEFDVQKAITLCDMTREPHARSTCLVSVAGTFSIEAHDTVGARAVCAETLSQDRARCMTSP